MISITLPCFSIFLLIVEKYPIFKPIAYILVYKIINLYMKFRNKIDKIKKECLRYDTAI